MDKSYRGICKTFIDYEVNMKQYTNESQTAKLIELGIEKPKGLADAEPSSGKWVREAYSIGELIEMLPKNGARAKSIEFYDGQWLIQWATDGAIYQTTACELCDALFEMICYLSEEEVI